MRHDPDANMSDDRNMLRLILSEKYDLIDFYLLRGSCTRVLKDPASDDSLCKFSYSAV